MSPLIFFLCMDYLDRILCFVSEQQGFKFHSMFKKLKLTHLSFADDLLLFCHGDFRSIYTLLQGVQMFFNASGLEVNKNKYEVYYARVHETNIQRVTDVSGFSPGVLPFKYLGVTISSLKMKHRDCHELVNKMVGRIRAWSSRNLSFAARSQLFNSVLMSTHVYWG